MRGVIRTTWLHPQSGGNCTYCGLLVPGSADLLLKRVQGSLRRIRDVPGIEEVSNTVGAPIDVLSTQGLNKASCNVWGDCGESASTPHLL